MTYFNTVDGVRIEVKYFDNDDLDRRVTLGMVKQYGITKRCFVYVSQKFDVSNKAKMRELNSIIKETCLHNNLTPYEVTSGDIERIRKYNKERGRIGCYSQCNSVVWVEMK